MPRAPPASVPLKLNRPKGEASNGEPLQRPGARGVGRVVRASPSPEHRRAERQDAVLTAFVRTDSAVYQLAAEQYMRHSPEPFADRCAACRARSCPVRLHAAEVIRAAGV